MSDDGAGDPTSVPWPVELDRAVLADSDEGRAIAAAFVANFGELVSGTVRPLLRQVAERGEEPQLLVNGLAQLLRDVADSIEFPVGPVGGSDGTAP